MSTWYDAVNDEETAEFISQNEVELKIAPGVLAFAYKTELKARYSDGTVFDVKLNAWIDRSQVYKATKHTNRLGLTSKQLLDFDPNMPIIFEMDGNEALKKVLEAGLASGRSVEDIVTDTGDDGFPIFFSLDNYKLQNTFQKQAVQ